MFLACGGGLQLLASAPWRFPQSPPVPCGPAKQLKPEALPELVQRNRTADAKIPVHLRSTFLLCPPGSQMSSLQSSWRLDHDANSIPAVISHRMGPEYKFPENLNTAPLLCLCACLLGRSRLLPDPQSLHLHNGDNGDT